MCNTQKDFSNDTTRCQVVSLKSSFMNPVKVPKKLAVTVRISPMHQQWLKGMAERTKRKEITVWEQMFEKCEAMPENVFWADPKLKVRN